MKLKRILQIAALVATAAGHASAQGLEALQGAWTMDGTGCEDTFHKVGDRIEYKDRGASVNTGILIDGKRILGPGTSCTAERVRQENDHLVAYLSCADAIMISGFSVSFRIIDATHVERIDSQFPEISETYVKCEF